MKNVLNFFFFVLTVMSVLFITYITFKQQKLTYSASKTGIFTFQVTNKMQFQIQQKLFFVFFVLLTNYCDDLVTIKMCSKFANWW